MSLERHLFGTDGIRAPFGAYPLDRATVTTLGSCLAAQLGRGRPRPVVVLGGDTRDSTPELCSWLAAGLEAGGASCRFAGVVPTPGVAALVRELGADAGAAVSASHNPHPDNGIKLIDGQGFKWEIAAEAELERRLGEAAPPAIGDPAPLAADPSLASRYEAALAASLDGAAPLSGLQIAIDAANGAAAPFAARLLGSLGAEVVALADRPDGRNINLESGSTYPAGMARATVEHGCDLGIAFDGDADRAVFADEAGAVRDGDAALYLWACALQRAGRLRPAAVVATTMSNLGLARALAEQGIELVRCDVGDRAVVETMRRKGILLGGEQSGHLVNLALSTTGDGLLTALQIAAAVRAAGRPMSELLAGFRRYPQVLLNVEIERKPPLASLPPVVEAAREVEAALGKEGRLLLRYSGTEPLARVMIEGPELGEIRRLAERLAAAIERELGARRSGAAAARQQREVR